MLAFPRFSACQYESNQEGHMGINILLADDSITIQKVVGIIFGGDDYTLSVVDNGKAAVEKAREVNPDVLLIDALMPGMSGYEVCEAVRSIPALSSKPILLLTGSFEPFDESKAKTCGADDVLSKPFESQQIINKVRELHELGLSRAVSASDAGMTEIPAESFAAEPAQPDTAGDIWDAFTAHEPDQEISFDQENEPASTFAADIFALPGQEVPPAPPVIEAFGDDSTANTAGSQWIPSEEATFEFTGDAGVESAVAEDTIALSSELLDVVGQVSYTSPAEAEPDDMENDAAVEFEMEESEPAAATEPPVARVTAPAQTVPVSLSEEQLREAIISASRDVIERIVWEVVPDLAEVMIRDAIRKIREGN